MTKLTKQIVQVGWKQLVKSYRKSVGDEDSYAPYDRINIYRRFLSSGTEEKGSYSYLFAEYGKAVSTTVSLDFGKMVIPESNVFSLNIAVKNETQRRQVFLPIVHRTFARKLTGFNHPELSKWTTDKPICFMLLLGSYWLVTVGVSGGTGLKVAAIDLEIGLDVLDFGVEAGISIGGNFTGHFFKTQDDAPAAYTSAISDSFTKDFYDLFGDDQFLIVDDFMTWYKKNVKDFIEPVMGPSWKTTLKDFALKRLPQISWVRKKQEKTKEDVENIIKWIYTKVRDPSFDASRFEGSPLMEQLDQFYKRVVDAEAKREPKRNIVEGESAPGLCFLDVIILSPAATAEGGAEAKAAVLELETKGEIVIKGALKGMIKTSYSRFQNYAKSQHRQTPLVMTQDAVISYKQIKVEAKGSLQIPKVWKGEGNAEKLLYNKMNYYAATSLWIPISSGEGTYNLQKGSGVSFGISVRFGALFEIAQSIFQKKNDKEAMMKSLANRLRVDENNFKEFVTALFSEDDLQQETTKVYPELMGKNAIIEYVLLEAAFIFTTPPSLSGVKNSARTTIDDPTQTTPFKKIFKNGSTATDLKGEDLELESLRVRIRIADNNENPERDRVFHLGLTYGGTGLIFNIENIKDAGNEGVFSMFTYFFANSLFKDDFSEVPENQKEDAIGIRRNTNERRELTVPTVFIPPHTLSVDDT